MKFIISTIIIALFTLSSCVITHKHDNGKHKGWYKNKKNPHNPNHNGKGKPVKVKVVKEHKGHKK